MYKILIVDDEPLILEGLQYVIDWEEHGAEIVARAGNGEEALTLLEQQTVHIVITDIKMPVMDGLQLIERAKSRGMNLKFIVLSGYDEFELVKKAVVHGVENYLLKPLEEDELSSTLLNTIDKLEHELHLSIQNRQNYSIVKENILYRWVNGHIGNDELQSRAEFLHIDLSCDCYMAGHVHIASRQAASPAPPEAADVRSKRGPLSFGVLNVCAETIGGFGNCMLFSSLNGDPILLFSWNGHDALEQERLTGLLEACIRNVKTYLKLDIAISLGTTVHDYQSVHLSYREACRTQERVLPQAGADDNAHPMMARIIKYIDEHYEEEMSLKTLSHQFHFNAAYLGQLFKKTTGEMFSAYLNRVRIENAKRLLTDTQMKAGDIAVKVGFSNVQYFSNVFHKLTGFYPTDYKKWAGTADGAGTAGWNEGIRGTM
ncbi:response regulator transcription factor [Paenibacillus sp. J5C_2022]|uniref:response regulator transcription factor n=1 Tax=Paenibacillus sp. J5C2022 TaxID=2977129 RepID=UPI0021D1C99B|nr:response regulator transcription factor [Paenibacillus sp. J5C2022]MCU6708810.1 response regulator transcription factor [Paenibacillus sp. J5C2022]